MATQDDKTQTPEAPAPVGLSGAGVVAAEATPPPAEAKPPEKEAAKPAPESEDDKPFTMTRAAWKSQVAEREKKAQEQLATSLGYKSVDEMKTMLARAAAKPEAAAAKPPAEKVEPDPAAAQPGETEEQKKLLAPMREKLRKEIAAGRQYKAEAARLKAEIEAAKVEFAAKESEAELRDVARAQGVVGDYVDDVLARLRKKIAAMNEEEIATFNEEEWIASLKEKHPFWFGVRSEPANAGNAEREQPGKPGAAAATKRAGEASAFNAMTASRKDVEARIAALGIPKPKTIN